MRRPPRSTQSRSSAASDVYKRQAPVAAAQVEVPPAELAEVVRALDVPLAEIGVVVPVSYTHLRAHETVLDLVCRLLLEKINQIQGDAVAADHRRQPVPPVRPVLLTTHCRTRIATAS